MFSVEIDKRNSFGSENSDHWGANTNWFMFFSESTFYGHINPFLAIIIYQFFSSTYFFILVYGGQPWASTARREDLPFIKILYIPGDRVVYNYGK